MKKIVCFIYLALFLFQFPEISWGDDSLERDIRVGVIETPPFVIRNDDQFEGIAIDIWSLIASNAHLKYHFILHPNTDYDDAVNKLAEGTYDILVGPISVTHERIQKVDYSLPFYLSQISLLVLRSKFSFVKNLVLTFLYTVGGLAAVLFLIFILYINVLWFFEKKHSEQLSVSYKEGLEKIFWRYVNEGKYIDIPKSWKGKITLLALVITLYVLLTLIQGSVISFMTVSWYQFANPINTAADIENKKIAADKGSMAYHLAHGMGHAVLGINDISEAIPLLKEKKIEAYVAPAEEMESYTKSQN